MPCVTFRHILQTTQQYIMHKLMVGDSFLALKIEAVCTVSVGVFCMGTVGSCFVRAPWAAVLYGHRGQLFCTGTLGSCFSDGWMDMTEIRRGCGMYLANGPVVIWYQDILL